MIKKKKNQWVLGMLRSQEICRSRYHGSGAGAGAGTKKTPDNITIKKICWKFSRLKA